MTSKQGRPFCLKAKCYILNKDESNTKLLDQCCNCAHIIYVGCSGFMGKGDVGDIAAYNWIRWWYHSIPYPHREQDPAALSGCVEKPTDGCPENGAGKIDNYRGLVRSLLGYEGNRLCIVRAYGRDIFGALTSEFAEEVRELFKEEGN